MGKRRNGRKSPSQRKREKVATSSPDLLAERIARLRELFPEAVGEAGVDFDKLRAALDDAVDARPDRYRFEWAGKRQAIALLQKPSTATLVPCPEESVNFDTTQNLFIEGENLEVLKLLYKAYAGRVKMIYIDPPYNTGNDFVYQDDYRQPLQAYLEQTGQAEARPEDARDEAERANRAGRFHSNWLSMMYPRLFLARQLLRDDGVIFVSIDDREGCHLRMLMNEVFGEENFLSAFVRRRRMATGMRGEPVSPDHEYVLAYARNAATVVMYGKSRTIEDYPYEDGKGKYRSTDLTVGMSKDMRPGQWYRLGRPESDASYWPPEGRVWRFQPSVMESHIGGGNIIWPEDFPERRMVRPRFKTRFDPKGILESVSPVSTWIAGNAADSNNDRVENSEALVAGMNQEGTRELRELLGSPALEYPKPVSLMQVLVRLATRDGDVILDFFAGSCSLAHGVLAANREGTMGRHFVMVQIPELTEEGTSARNAGFHTVAEVGKERIRRVISKLEEEDKGKFDFEGPHQPEDLGFAVFKLRSSNMRQWADEAMEAEGADAGEYVEKMELFDDPLVDGWKPIDVIYEVALKEAGYGLNCRLEQFQTVETNTVYRVTDPDRGLHFHICLDDELDAGTPKALGLFGDSDLFVCRDAAVDDTLAANLALQCRLKTI